MFPAGRFEDEGIANAGKFADVFEIGCGEFASKDGRFFENGETHSGAARVDAEERRAGDDGAVVNSADAGAEEFEVVGIFKRDCFFAGHGERGGGGGELSVGERAVGVRVRDGAAGGGAFGGGNVPGLRGGGDEHGAGGGADAAEHVVVGGRGGAAAGDLRGEAFVQAGLLDGDFVEIDV